MYKISTKTDKPDIKYMFDESDKMMKRGIKLKNLKELYSKYNSIKEKLATEINTKYNIANPNSSKQIIEYLENLSSKLVNFGETNDIYEICFVNGKWTSNKAAMMQLSNMGYEFATDLLLYRLAKKYSETLKTFISLADNNGIIHPFVELGKTNRIQYSKPALLTIPKVLLWHLVDPMTEGNKLYSVDIKNQEPNILINILGSDELKTALVADEGLYENLFSKVYRPKVTLHVAVGQENNDAKPRILTTEELRNNKEIAPVFYTPIRAQSKSLFVNEDQIQLINVYNTLTFVNQKMILPDKVAVMGKSGREYELDVEWPDKDKVYKKAGTYEIYGNILGVDVKCNKEERAEFKRSWLAMTYGASKNGILAMCNSLDGSVIYDYFSKIPEFKEYNAACNKFARSGIQNIKTAFGTIMFANETNQARLRRVLLDLPVQGTGADILSLLIKHFNEYTEQNGLSDKISIYFTRHDELIIEANGKWVEEIGDSKVCEILTDILEHQIDDWTPFKVEVSQVEKAELPEFGADELEDIEE